MSQPRAKLKQNNPLFHNSPLIIRTSGRSFGLQVHNSFFPNDTVQNRRILPAAFRGFVSAQKMGAYVSDEVDAAAATSRSDSCDGFDAWETSVPAHGTSHSVSRKDCFSLRVLRLVFRSSITGLLFPVGVRHSMSSRVSWVSWSACSSLATILSKFSVLGWPSQSSRSKSTWKKWTKFLIFFLVSLIEHPTMLECSQKPQEKRQQLRELADRQKHSKQKAWQQLPHLFPMKSVDRVTSATC